MNQISQDREFKKLAKKAELYSKRIKAIQEKLDRKQPGSSRYKKLEERLHAYQKREASVRQQIDQRFPSKIQTEKDD